MKLSNIVLRRFLCTDISLEVGISILSGMFTMLAFIMLIVNGAEFQYNYSKDPSIILIGIICIIICTWLVAFFGAYISSISLIQLSIALWAVFIITWIGLSVLTVYGNKNFCVATKSRCAPTMWLFEDESGDAKCTEKNLNKDSGENGGKKLDENDYKIDISRDYDYDEDESNDEWGPDDYLDSDGNNDVDIENKFYTISQVHYSVKETEKRTSETTSKFISRNSTTANPSSNLTTRVIQFKMITKSIATSHDAINLNIINRVPRKIDKRDDHDGGVVDSKPAEELKPEEKENPLKYIITITYFLPLFLYSWFVLISYCVELKCMMSCNCEHFHCTTM